MPSDLILIINLVHKCTLSFKCCPLIYSMFFKCNITLFSSHCLKGLNIECPVGLNIECLVGLNIECLVGLNIEHLVGLNMECQEVMCLVVQLIDP